MNFKKRIKEAALVHAKKPNMINVRFDDALLEKVQRIQKDIGLEENRSETVRILTEEAVYLYLREMEDRAFWVDRTTPTNLYDFEQFMSVRALTPTDIIRLLIRLAESRKI